MRFARFAGSRPRNSWPLAELAQDRVNRCGSAGLGGHHPAALDFARHDHDQAGYRDRRRGPRSPIGPRSCSARSGALREGHFQLKSGRHGDAYVEKFAVLSDPAATSELCGFWAATHRGEDGSAPRRPRRRTDDRRRHPRLRDRPPARGPGDLRRGGAGPGRARPDASSGAASGSSLASGSCSSTTSSRPADRCWRCCRPSRRWAARSSSASSSSTGAAAGRTPDLADDRPRLPAPLALAARPADLRARRRDLSAMRRRHAPPRTGEQRDRGVTDAPSSSDGRRTRPALVARDPRRRSSSRWSRFAWSPPSVLGGPGRQVETGIVVAVEATEPRARSRASRSGPTDGRTVDFRIGTLENAPTFPPGHLAEHKVSLVPVRVTYVDRRTAATRRSGSRTRPSSELAGLLDRP